MAAAVVALGGTPAQGQESPFRPLAYTVSGGDTIQVVDLEAGRLLDDIRVPGSRFIDIDSGDHLHSFVYALDAANSAIAVIDAVTDQVVRTVPVSVPGEMTSLSMSDSGDLAIVADGAAVFSVRMDSGFPALVGRVDAITGLAVEPEGRTAYVTTAGSITYHQIVPSGAQGSVDGLSAVNAVAAGDGRVVTGGRVISVFAGDEPKRLQTIDIGADTRPGGIVFFNSGRVIAAVDGRIVDIALAGELVQTLAEIDLPNGIDQVAATVFGIGADGKLRAFDVARGELRPAVALRAGSTAAAGALVRTEQRPPTSPPPSSTPTTVEPTDPTDPTDPPSTTTSGEPVPTTGTVPTTPAGGTGDGGGLATTGTEVRWWAVAGVLLVLVGGLVVVVGRPRLRRG